MGTISGHQLATFSSPVNGTTPIDANVVRSNDNTIKTSYNAHDADATIHLQSGAASARPSQGTAGQTWLATDTGAVYLSIDNGSAWVDINYIRTTVTSLPSNVVSSSLTTVGILASPHMTSPTVDSGGMTISSGTLAAQAVTATSVTASTSFQIGGATATDVRLQHSGGALQVRLGDNSDYGDLSVRAATITSGLTVSAGGITVSAGTSAFQAVQATNYNTGSSTVSVPNATPTTVVTLAHEGLYIIKAIFNGGDHQAYAIVSFLPGGGAHILAQAASAGTLTFSISGTNVQLNNTSGSTLSYNIGYQIIS